MNLQTILVVTCLSVFGVARAQGNVAVYGSLDEAAVRINNLGGGHVSRLDTGTTQPDRVGFHGSEDLGGGVHAEFALEHGFFTDTGSDASPTEFFNRLATVGLSGSLGSVALGHQPDLMNDWVGKTSNGILLSSFYAFHPGNFDVLANTFQYDNAIRCNTPAIGGLTLGAIYGFGESPAGSSVDRNFSVGANYVRDSLHVAAAYSVQNDRTLRGFAPFAPVSGLPASGVMDQVKNAGLGASYRHGNFAVNSVYTQSKMIAGASSATMRNLDLGLSYEVAPAFTLNGGYTRSTLKDVNWNTYSLMGMYHFSKRTQVYALGTFQRASSGQVAVINGAGASSDQNQNVMGAGIHHSF